MSGGIKRVRIDSNRDFLHLRRAKYGFELASLPSNLALAQVDDEFSRHTNPAYASSKDRPGSLALPIAT